MSASRRLIRHPLPRRAPTRGLASLGALSLLLLLVGCGGGDGAGSDAGSGDQAAPGALARIDACALLSTDDVGQVLGTTVTGPSKREAGDESALATICIYDGGWPNSVNLTVRQSTNPGQATTSATLAADLNEDIDDMAESETMADLVEGGRWQPLEMEGHAAAVRDAGEAGWTTVVREEGHAAVEVLINAPNREAGVTLARMVMDRLR